MNPTLPFTRHGTQEQRIEVSVDEILNAIAERRDVEYVAIDAHRLVGAVVDYAGSGVRVFDAGRVD